MRREDVFALCHQLLYRQSAGERPVRCGYFQRLQEAGDEGLPEQFQAFLRRKADFIVPRWQARLAKFRRADALADVRNNGVKVGQFMVTEVLRLSGKQCPEREWRFCQRLVDGIAKEVLLAVCTIDYHHGMAAVAVRQCVQRALLAGVARKRAEHGKGAFDVYAAVVLEEGKQFVEDDAAGDLCRGGVLKCMLPQTNP